MFPSADQILTVAQMRGGEQALIDTGGSVDGLMQVAGRGAADLVWRVAGHRKVTVLCGPGNNGGDGYVIAEAIRERGGRVAVLSVAEPKTAAAATARALFQGDVLFPGAEPGGDILVDCLFGSGLTRPLTEPHAALLARLARSHPHRIAIDVPSGVEADSGALLSPDLQHYDLTIALGAWKFAHFLMPASATMGMVRLVDIGVVAVPGAAIAITRPQLSPPAADAHKYRRGLLAVLAGAMPGAAVLAATAAQGAGAGYVKLLADQALPSQPDLVVSAAPSAEALADPRIAALLVGPGLGRGAAARTLLAQALASGHAAVLDADALLLVDQPVPGAIATPHDGERHALEATFGCDSNGSKPERALALARTSGMVVVAKGPDTVIAAPDGRVACAHPATSWLSVAGTGDVLAGVIASRLATGEEPFVAACQGVWLHGEAARLSGAAFTAGILAAHIPAALAACL